jgi:hypothetical protein
MSCARHEPEEGFSAMPDSVEYRAYTISADGHIQKRFDLTATDEQAAREQAEGLLDGYEVELWLGTKRIAKFAHKH